MRSKRQPSINVVSSLAHLCAVGLMGAGTSQVLAAEQKTSSGSADRSPIINEVIVTAQKTDQRLQDVPVAVAVVSTEKLAANNQTRLREYFDTVPGFTVAPTPTGGNQQVLAIRGITNGIGGNPTVGVTVDDVPYGAFSREFALDLDPNDLQRVELLRGPQGTLYGANSMGGILTYVTVDPNTEELSGRVDVGFSSIRDGDNGYNARGAVNVPITDQLAVRASAFTREDPGFIDNPIIGKEDVNGGTARGGRVSALYRPSADWLVKISALYQEVDFDGLGEVDVIAGLGEFEQAKLRGVGRSEQTTEAYSAIVKGQIGEVSLASVTGYNVYEVESSNDYTFLQGARAQLLYGVSGAEQFTYNITRKLTQELRAVVPLGERVEWLVGGFYSHERNPLDQGYNAVDPVTGNRLGEFSTLHLPIEFTEYAAFTDVTVRLTDRFDVQIGGRQSFLDIDFESTTSVAVPGATPSVTAAINAKPDVFTYLFTPRFKISPDMMVYARVASGYRPSRSNAFNPDPAISRTAQPDETQNYELGFKGTLLNGMMSFDTSLYYIDWEDLQITLINPTNRLSYFTNGGSAKSEGVEATVSANPWTGMSVSLAGSYNNAVLTEAFPAGTAAFGVKGNRLPFSARVSGSLAFDQEFPLGPLEGSVGMTLSYVGDRIGTFVATPARAEYPGYGKLDVRAGVSFDDWKVNLYAKNVTDKRALLGGGPGTLPPFAYYFVQPRTIGMSVVKDF